VGNVASVFLSLPDLVVLFVSFLFEELRLLVEAQEPILQLLPGHLRDVLTLSGILMKRHI